jgi:hypothetical protein
MMWIVSILGNMIVAKSTVKTRELAIGTVNAASE